MLSDEDPQDAADDFVSRTNSVRRLKLTLPKAACEVRRSSAIDYDESECVSDTSFASESCTSTFARKCRSTTPTASIEAKVCSKSNTRIQSAR